MKQIQRNLKNVKKRNVALLKSKIKDPKWVGVFLVLMFHSIPMFAQNNINAQLNTWAGNIKSTLNIVVGIFAIVGGFMVFLQYMQGNEQAQRNFIRFVIGLAIFGLVTLIANVFLPSGSLTVNN